MSAPRLWERDRHLGTADGYLASARQGRGGALFLLGGAGLGKTTLLDEVCRRAGDGTVVVRAWCDPMEAALPYGLMSQVVHGLGGDVDLGPAASEGGGGQARSTILYTTLRWLEDVARQPVVVAIDDLQWSDADSLVLLGFLCRRLAGLPVMVVASLRPWPAPASDLAWSLVHRGDASLEQLLPLTKDAAAGVLADRLGEPCPPDTAARLWQLTGGNPLLLGLAASTHAGEGAVAVEDEGLSLSAIERSLVLTRFTALSPAATRWAQAGAVMGLAFSPELVAEVARLDSEEAEGASEAVWRSGLIRNGRNGSAEFVHPLFRQLLYRDIDPLARSRLHGRAFAALASRALDDAAAEHAIRADMTGDAAAIRVLTETGRRALRAGAPATAASRLKAAVRLSGQGAAVPLAADLAEALYEAGYTMAAATTAERVLETDVSLAERVAALTMLSRAHFSMGDFVRAGATLESAVVLAEHDLPQAVVVPLCRHADAVMMTAGPAAALPLAARARQLAEGGSRRLQAQATAKWGALASYTGDPAGLTAVESVGRELLRAGAGDLAADIRAGGSGVLVPYAVASAPAERFEEAESAFLAGLEEADRVGAVSSAAALRVPYGLMLLRVRLRDSLAVADRLLGVADPVPLAEPCARTITAYAALETGEEQQSATEGERARVTATAFGSWISLLWLDHVQGLHFLRHGRYEEASDLYSVVEARYQTLGVGEPCIVPFARHAVVAHARAARTQDAERVIAWLDACAGRLRCRWPGAAAAGGRALLALRSGDRAAADSAYRAALSGLEGVPLPLERAELLIEHGTMLRRDGRPLEARESLRQAGELAESVGGVWLARRAGEELAAAGGRRRSRRGAQVLTPQEQAIARLAATGASDKDIAAHLVVTVRTVRTHLEHVYAKLDIHSRRDLMAMGERLESLIGHKG